MVIVAFSHRAGLTTRVRFGTSARSLGPGWTVSGHDGLLTHGRVWCVRTSFRALAATFVLGGGTRRRRGGHGPGRQAQRAPPERRSPFPAPLSLRPLLCPTGLPPFGDRMCFPSLTEPLWTSPGEHPVTRTHLQAGPSPRLRLPAKTPCEVTPGSRKWAVWPLSSMPGPLARLTLALLLCQLPGESGHSPLPSARLPPRGAGPAGTRPRALPHHLTWVCGSRGAARAREEGGRRLGRGTEG